MRISLGVGCLLLGVGVGLGRESVVRIDPEHAGVIYRRFTEGTDVSMTMDEGLHFIAPWSKVFSYDLREQKMERVVTGLSKDGLWFAGKVEVRIRLTRNGLGFLHKSVGPDYAEKVVWPEVTACCRRMLGQFEQNELEAIPNELRQKVEREITDHLLSFGIVITAVRFEETWSAVKSEAKSVAG